METIHVCAKCSAEFPSLPTWCPSCGAFKTFYPRWARQADSLFRGGPRRATAEDLVRVAARCTCSENYPALRLPPVALLAVYGPPGSGKSTWTAKFLDGFPGSVLLISQEEALGETVAGRMRRLEICRPDFHLAVVSTLDELADLVTEIRPQAIAIDSVTVTSLTVGDLQRLTTWAKVPLVAVLHATKAGAAAGSLSLLHAADAVLKTEGMRWRLEKSRTCPLVEGEV